jgi:hypothetical protein
MPMGRRRQEGCVACTTNVGTKICDRGAGAVGRRCERWRTDITRGIGGCRRAVQVKDGELCPIQSSAV